MKSKLNNEVALLLENMPIGMTKFQLKHFVVGDQPTLLHQLRQVVNEIDVRESSFHKFTYKVKKKSLELDILREKLRGEENRSSLEIQLSELEFDHESWKLSSSERTLKGSRQELGYLYEILEDLTDGVDVNELLDNFDRYDEIYWTKRLGKQAAVDMATGGRISAGNLAAIELMPEELKQQSLLETMRLANEYTENIQSQINAQEKQSQIENKPKLDKKLME